MEKHARRFQSQEANQPTSQSASKHSHNWSFFRSSKCLLGSVAERFVPATLIYHLIILKSAQQVIENFKLSSSTHPRSRQVGFVFSSMDFPFEWFPFFGSFPPFPKKAARPARQLTGGQRFVTFHFAAVLPPRHRLDIMPCHHPFPFCFHCSLLPSTRRCL